jgi:hypothetical protein
MLAELASTSSSLGNGPQPSEEYEVVVVIEASKLRNFLWRWYWVVCCYVNRRLRADLFEQSLRRGHYRAYIALW